MMRITKKTVYGVQALADIAANQTDRPVKLREISKRLGVSEKFLGQIFKALMVGGIVESRRGPSGGYSLKRSAREITLHEVLEVTEGPLQIVPCVGARNPNRERCSLEGRCPASPAWEDIHSQMVHLFKEVTLRDLYG